MGKAKCTIMLLTIVFMAGCTNQTRAPQNENSKSNAPRDKPMAKRMFVAGPQNSGRSLYVYASPDLAAKLHSINEDAKLVDDGKMAVVRILGQQQVTVINETAEAYQVHLPDGRTGWIKRDLLESESIAERDERFKQNLVKELDTRNSGPTKGLSEAKKREIYYQALLAEDRVVSAPKPGNPISPDPFGRNAVAKRYGITEKELIDIEVEGYARKWPEPKKP